MSPSPDPYAYQVLGVQPGASEKEIRQAYLRLAWDYHPDRNPDPDAEEYFKKITWAYNQFGRPADEQVNWVPERTEDPPPPPWLTPRKVLLGVAAIVILIVFVIVILNLGSPPAAPPAAAATPSAQPSAEAAAEAAQVNVLLNASAGTTRPLATALEDVRTCNQVGTAITTISAVEQRYAKLYEMAMQLNTGQLPNGAALKNDLIQAYYHSMYSNYHFLNWAEQRESSRCTVQRGSEYDAGKKDAAQAAQFKDAFVGLWNPVARSYGLPQRSAGGI
jgi:DnaJ domain